MSPPTLWMSTTGLLEYSFKIDKMAAEEGERANKADRFSDRSGRKEVDADTHTVFLTHPDQR